MKPPVPLLFVIHALGHGGMERQVAAIAGGLDRDRYSLHVASVLEGCRAEEMRANGIPIVALPIRSFRDPGPRSIVAYLRKYIREQGIRLVHNSMPA